MSDQSCSNVPVWLSEGLTRRQTLVAGMAGLLPLTGTAWPLLNDADKFRMGVIADLHHGLAPTAMSRLETFMKQVDQQRPDAILQLGDFNYGKPDSEECLRLWRTFEGPRHHVLGNHDMDVYGKPHMVEKWEMPRRYYSFDAGGFHFVILDRNNLYQDGKYTPYEAANFYVDGKLRGFVDPEQLEWLREDLQKTKLPTAIFMHQGMGMPDQLYPVKEANAPLEKLFAEVNRGLSRPKIVACFCGHHHIDRYNFLHGIHFVWINSASYYWVGANYGKMAPYREALFCFMTFHADGTIEIEGRETEWEEPTPAQRGVPEPEKLNTLIRDRRLLVGSALKE